MFRRLAARTSPLLLVLSLAACHPGERVVRVVDGREVPGHWISPEAYAAYLEGALAEAAGNHDAARAAYVRAAAHDPDSAAAWARLGKLECTRSPEDADEALDRARSLGPELEEPWLASSECALERGHAANALRFGERAAELAPYDAAASLAVAAALEEAGDAARANRWRRALALRMPGGEMAVPAETRPGGAAPRTNGESDARADLDRAIRAGDGAAIRAASLRARISSSELALRALEVGRVDVARPNAERALAAEPASGDARVAALTSADLAGDETALSKWASAVPPGGTAPSPKVAPLMEALLARRIGKSAARAWSLAYRDALDAAAGTPSAPGAE